MRQALTSSAGASGASRTAGQRCLPRSTSSGTHTTSPMPHGTGGGLVQAAPLGTLGDRPARASCFMSVMCFESRRGESTRPIALRRTAPRTPTAPPRRSQPVAPSPFRSGLDHRHWSWPCARRTTRGLACFTCHGTRMVAGAARCHGDAHQRLQMRAWMHCHCRAMAGSTRRRDSSFSRTYRRHPCFPCRTAEISSWASVWTSRPRMLGRLPMCGTLRFGETAPRSRPPSRMPSPYGASVVSPAAWMPWRWLRSPRACSSAALPSSRLRRS